MPVTIGVDDDTDTRHLTSPRTHRSVELPAFVGQTIYGNEESRNDRNIDVPTMKSRYQYVVT